MPIRKGSITLFANMDLSKVRVTEFQKRYPEQLNRYLGILEEFPEDHLGLLLVKPTTDGYFELLDGHHRYLSYIMMGRRNVLTVIIEERYIDDPRSNDQSFVAGICAELAEAAGDDARSANLRHLRETEGQGPVEVMTGQLNRLAYEWQCPPQLQDQIKKLHPGLADALDWIAMTNPYKEEI